MMRGSPNQAAVSASRARRVRKEPERLEAGPASSHWSSTRSDSAPPPEPYPVRSKRTKLTPSTPRKCTTPEGFRARQIATSELNERQLELLGLYTKMFPVQAAEDPDCMIETVSMSTSFVIRHGKTREVLAGISFKTFANQKMATVELIATTMPGVGHGTALLDTLYDHMQKTGQHEGMMLYAFADLDAVQFFHKQGFRPVDDANYADVTARLAAHGVVEPTPSKLMFTSVENQLFVGQVREAAAQAQALGPELVGQRVEVYWSGENVWFPGHVAAYRAQERIHYVIYDDGESVWERLTAKDCKALGPGPARAQLDTTVCAICNGNGTAGPLYGPFDSNRRKDLYVHEHCIMFNSCVRLVGGSLRGVGDVIATAKKTTCKRCRKKGASVACAHDGCKAAYHYKCCKLGESCYFQSEQYEFYCPGHRPRTRRKDARRGGISEDSDTASSADESTAQHRSLFGTASCEMLAPAACSPDRNPPASSEAEPAPASTALTQAQNNGASGGWTLCEDRCLAAIMDAAKQTPARANSNRPAAKYSWSQISVVIARLVDSACKRSENSCRHRWNKIAGVYKPTAEEKRRAKKFLELSASDESNMPASSTDKQPGSVGRDSFDGGDIAVRQCQQKVIVAGDDEGSDADNDVVEVVSVGADIKRLPELPPGYVRASARPAPGTTARDVKRGDSGSDTLPEKRRTTSAATAARTGNRARRGVAPPHPPAAIVRSPAQHLNARAETTQGKRIRRSGGINGREVRIHVVGSGGNCRICRNGRGVCRKRGAPGHLEAEQPVEKQDGDDDDDDPSPSEENDEEHTDGADNDDEDDDEDDGDDDGVPERPKTRRRSNRS